MRFRLTLSTYLLALLSMFLALPAFAQTTTPAAGPFGVSGAAGGILSLLLGLVLGQHLLSKAWSWVTGKLKPANVTISTNHTANDLINAFLNAGEGVLTHTITGDKLEALLQLVAGGASGASVMAFLSTNFGATLVDQVKAAIGPLATEEATVLFGNRGAVEQQIQLALARVAPQVAQAKSAAQLSAAQVASSLAFLSSPKPSQPPAAT